MFIRSKRIIFIKIAWISFFSKVGENFFLALIGKRKGIND